MKLLLITNDDGVRADGLARLAEAAQAFGEVWIVAPDGQRSAASHSITLHAPVDVFPCDPPVPGVHAFACSGTPADCVRVGCLSVLPRKPDAVLSGINLGYNAGTDLQYSATAGAAFEGAFQGVLSIALSEDAGPCRETTDAYLHEVLSMLLEEAPDRGRIFNVNFPGCPLADCKGIRSGRSVSRESFFHDLYPVQEELPGGGLRLMVHGVPNSEAEEGSDMRAIMDGFVSIGEVNNVGLVL